MSYDAVQQSRSNEKRVLLGYNANANAVVIALDMMCMAWKKRCEFVSASFDHGDAFVSDSMLLLSIDENRIDLSSEFIF